MIFQFVMAPTAGTTTVPVSNPQRITGSCQHNFTASSKVRIKVISFTVSERYTNQPEPLRIDFGGLMISNLALGFPTLTTGNTYFANPTAYTPFSLVLPTAYATVTPYGSEYILEGIIGTTNSGITSNTPYGVISADLQPYSAAFGQNVVNTGGNMALFDYAVLTLEITQIE